MDEENISHLIYQYIYTKLFWFNGQTYLKGKSSHLLQLGKNIYFEDGEKEKGLFCTTFFVFWQFHVLKKQARVYRFLAICN